MKTKITRDGHKNVVVMVHGEISEKGLSKTSVLDIKEMEGSPKGFKLDQIQYTVSKDVTIELGFSKDGFLLPIEGRGLLNYYPFDSLQPSSLGQSLWIRSAAKSGSFHLVLDCTKIE